MEPIRILHIVTYMGRGGLETTLMNYYRHMDRSRVQFDFLVHRDFQADYDREILDLGGRIYRLPPLNPLRPGYLAALEVFFRVHREYRVVHCHLDCMAGIPLRAAKRQGVPVCIAHAHSSSQTRDRKYLLKLLFRRMIPRYADHLFACARAAGEFMFPGRDFTVLNNAIAASAYTFDPRVRGEVRAELGIAPGELVVGHVGRFMTPKNHGFLLEIFAGMGAGSRLLLVGEGELMDGIRARAQALGIAERVIFTGLRTDVNRLLQAMDVFVMPSLYEGLSVALVEAQAAGLPCVISDKVPMECKKTEPVTQLSLEQDAETWARVIAAAAEIPRENTLAQIRGCGFDIEENARWLTGFYLEQYGKRD